MAKIKFTPEALNDIIQVKEYITNELSSESSASNTIHCIIK